VSFPIAWAPSKLPASSRKSGPSRRGKGPKWRS
jgi:hypothetical protein